MIMKIVMKGIVWSLFLNKNSIAIEATVIPSVKMLNSEKVNLKLSNGLTRADDVVD